MAAVLAEHANSSMGNAGSVRVPRNFESILKYIDIRAGPEPVGPEVYELSESERTMMLYLRLFIIALLLTLLLVHVKSLRMFRWEQSVTGGVLITYTIAFTGMAIGMGAGRCGTRALQAYLSSTGAALFFANCGGIWRRWRRSPEVTLALAELLVALGVPLRRYVIIKVCMSALIGLCMLVDLVLIPVFVYLRYGTEPTSGKILI